MADQTPQTQINPQESDRAYLEKLVADSLDKDPEVIRKLVQKLAQSRPNGMSVEAAARALSALSATGGDSEADEGLLDRVVETAAGPRGAAAKDKAAHKFWNTQPVPDAGMQRKEGPLQISRVEDVPTTAHALPADFEWCTVNVDDGAQLDEVFRLLSSNYVEDLDSLFRFAYSPAFLEWALKPPGWRAEWHVGVRVAATKRLVAFISGIPVSMHVRGRPVSMVEINFLCVHKKLRAKRLAPVLIQEVTRRVNLHGIWQAVYTAGVRIPTPFTVCRYFHRPLNVKKCVDTGFSQLPQGVDLARLQLRYRIAPNAVAAVPGLREMRDADVPAVRKRLNHYLRSFVAAPEFSVDEVRHWLVPREKVVHALVVEDPARPGRLSGFVSYYSLPSTVLAAAGGATAAQINAAYLYYYFVEVDPVDGESAEEHAARRRAALERLVKAALATARDQGFDVVNCLDMLDNASFLEPLRFGKGDGSLHYYMFNYFLRGIEPSQCGLVML